MNKLNNPYQTSSQADEEPVIPESPWASPRSLCEAPASKWQWYRKPTFFGQGIGLAGEVIGVMVSIASIVFMGIAAGIPHLTIIGLAVIGSIFFGIIGLIDGVASSLLMSVVGGGIVGAIFVAIITAIGHHTTHHVTHLSVTIILIFAALFGVGFGAISSMIIRIINTVIGAVVSAVGKRDSRLRGNDGNGVL